MLPPHQRPRERGQAHCYVNSATGWGRSGRGCWYRGGGVGRSAVVVGVLGGGFLGVGVVLVEVDLEPEAFDLLG